MKELFKKRKQNEQKDGFNKSSIQGDEKLQEE